LALSDSSNHLLTRKGLSFKHAEADFKKPTAPGKTKMEKSGFFNTDPIIEMGTKPRSQSVPSIMTPSENPNVDKILQNKSSTVEDFNGLFHYDSEIYPDQEFFREIPGEDAEDYYHYENFPIQRALERAGLEVYVPTEEEMELLIESDGSDEELIEDGDLNDDDSYPEVERLPLGYSRYLNREDLESMRLITTKYGLRK